MDYCVEEWQINVVHQISGRVVYGFIQNNSYENWEIMSWLGMMPLLYAR